MKKAPLHYLLILALSILLTSCLFEKETDKTEVTESGSSFDTDGDGIADIDDNCLNTQNATQSDADFDGIGDVCEENDMDQDGINDDVDNCPDDKNTDQRDLDEDGTGDACEEDTDSDGIPDPWDNCPEDDNKLQNDKDNDGKGDACEDFDDTSDIPIPENFRMEENFPTFLWNAVEGIQFYAIEVICLEGCEIYTRLMNSGLFKGNCYDETENKIIENSIHETKYKAGTDLDCPTKEVFFPGVLYKARVGAAEDETRVSFTEYFTFTISQEKPLSYNIDFAFDKATSTISWNGLRSTNDTYTLGIQCITGCAYYYDFEETGCFNKDKRLILQQNINDTRSYTLGSKARQECKDAETFFDNEFYSIAITYLTGIPEFPVEETVTVYYWNK